MADWAAENAPDVSLERETAKFADYWRSVPGARGVKRDWAATWRNWMRRAQDDVERWSSRQARPGGGGRDADAEIAAFLAAGTGTEGPALQVLPGGDSSWR